MLLEEAQSNRMSDISLPDFVANMTACARIRGSTNDLDLPLVPPCRLTGSEASRDFNEWTEMSPE